MRYRDPIIEATGKMPFAGKHIAKFLFQKSKESSENGNLVAKLGGAAALGVFGLMHYNQLKMGVTELTHAENSNIAEVAIDLGYTVANGMVVYTQTMLTGLALFTRKKENQIYEEAPVEQFAYAGHSEAYNDTDYQESSIIDSNNQKSPIKFGQLSLAEFAFTMCGQILFLATKQDIHS